MNVEHIAQVCHEANRVLQISVDDPAVSPHWEDAPEWQKTSAVEGVLQAQRGVTSEELHASWIAFKVNDGWTLGDVKDAEAKTHPSLVPYQELPLEEKVKDHLFKAIVELLS